MKKMYKIILIVFGILILIIFSLFYFLNTVKTNEVLIGNSSKLSTLYITILDQNTKQPIEDVIVCLGNCPIDRLKCDTNKDGVCIINDFASGSSSIKLFKKGYLQKIDSSEFIGDVVNYTIELEKNKIEPISVSVKGKIVKKVFAKGTESEDIIYYLKQGDDLVYIFNDVGQNKGFNKFVNWTVEITGYKEKGYIGWSYQEVDGIYIEKIKKSYFFPFINILN